MIKKLFLVFIVLLLSIVLGSYSSYVNLHLMKTISDGQTPLSNQWIVWIIFQLLTVYNFFPDLINWIISEEISYRIAGKFIGDLKKCSSEKVEAKTQELEPLFRKLCGISHIPNKIGWILENFINMINNSLAIWYISGYWVLLVLCSGFFSAVLDEYIHSAKTRKLIIKDLRKTHNDINKHIYFIPLWNGTRTLNMEISFPKAVHKENIQEQKFNDFWRNKNILPEITSFLVSTFILININGIISDSSILLLALTNLGFLINSTKCFIRNANAIRIDITKIGDYNDEIKKLGNKIKLDISNKIPNGITQLTGKSGQGKTCLIREIIENIGHEIIYLSQFDQVNYNDMTPSEAVLYLQKKHNKILVKKCLKIAGLNKEINEKLKRPSGGEIQKIRIARTIYTYLCEIERNIILMDEPDNNIDAGLDKDTEKNIISKNGFKQIMESIFKVLRSDTKLIFTTHKGFALEKSWNINQKNVEEMNKLIFE